MRNAYFAVFGGFPGCLPEYVGGPIGFYRRREFVQFVNDELRMLDLSDRSRRQINLVKVWRHIQQHGNGFASFIIEDTQPGSLYRLEFRNLTESEFVEMERDWNND